MDLQTAETLLNTWQDAETAVASGASYSIGSRSLTRADLNEITDRITKYRREVKRLSGQTTMAFPAWR